MSRLYTMPRRAHCGPDVFAIAQGEYGSPWGWVILDQLISGPSSESCDYLSGCKWCNTVPPGSGDYYCSYHYSVSRKITDWIFHFAVFFYQGIETPFVLTDVSLISASLYGYWSNLYLRAPVFEPWEGCKASPALQYPVSAHVPGTGYQLRYVTLDRYTKEDKPPSWFRALWNSIFTYHQVAPDEACMIEPDNDYVCFYGTMATDNGTFGFGSSGWASPFGDCGHCEDGPGGSLMLPGVFQSWNILKHYQQPATPAYLYPITFYHNGVFMGATPALVEPLFTYYNRNNPPWDAPP